MESGPVALVVADGNSFESIKPIRRFDVWSDGGDFPIVRILFIEPVYPLPIQSGARIRLYNLIKCLKEQGHEVGLICFFQPADLTSGPEVDEFHSWLSDLRVIRLGVKRGLVGKFRRLLGVMPGLLSGLAPEAAFALHPEVVQAVRELADKYDIIKPEFYFMSRNIPDDLLRKSPDKFVLAEADVSYIAMRRLAQISRWPRKALDLIHYYGGKRAEEREIRRYRKILAMSDPDASLLHQIAPGAEIAIVPNGVDCRAISFHPKPEVLSPPLSLLYVGPFSFFPNMDAMRFFIDECWPILRQRLPGINLTIMGNQSGVDLAPFQVPGVEFTGFVKDATGYYARSHATATPLRVGGGTRLKILEAMSAGLPVVSTKVGIEGIPARPGEDYLPAENSNEYVLALTRLLEEPGLARRLSENGRRLVETQFDWPIIAEKLIRFVEEK